MDRENSSGSLRQESEEADAPGALAALVGPAVFACTSPHACARMSVFSVCRVDLGLGSEVAGLAYQCTHGGLRVYVHVYAVVLLHSSVASCSIDLLQSLVCCNRMSYTHLYVFAWQGVAALATISAISPEPRARPSIDPVVEKKFYDMFDGHQ